jgi:hypothetical protein
MKTLPIVKHYTTEEEQANFLMDIRFDAVDRTDFNEDDWSYNADVIFPDDILLIDEFIDDVLSYDVDIEEELQEYNEENEVEDTEDSDEFKEWLIDKYNSEFDEWKCEKIHKYPMWNIIWKCDDLTSQVNELYQCGMTLIEFNGEYYIGIDGAGYSFVTEHFIPFFKKLGWIEQTDDNTKYKERLDWEYSRFIRFVEQLEDRENIEEYNNRIDSIILKLQNIKK